tara:strand:- start:1652 stop:2701 length:1050 start_codon:yes stop_codon:yes gene_type:complete
MAVINYEPLDSSTDVTTTVTLLYEAIPLTGTIVSGTYNDENIKNFTHGMFQAVYDYPYLSSSANHIFDLAVGYSSDSTISGSTSVTQESKKINMYNEFAQVLLGYTGSNNTVREFEKDLNLDNTGSIRDAFFINFSRLITKDQIKKGSFSMTLGTGSWSDPFRYGAIDTVETLTDASASATGGTTNTIGGDYGLLYTTGSTVRGIVFYQAGIAVIGTGSWNGVADFNSGSSPVYSYTTAQSLASASISGSCDALRHRIQNISFNNTTEINSTIYFCRVPHNKYNYSANPTYVSSSEIRVKSIASDTPISYITTIGLYSPNNELMAIAKLSEPLRKDPSNEITLRVRLDY